MNDRERKRDELKRKSQESARRADELLASELETLKNATKVDLDNLRPKITDKATYDKLIANVDQATDNNMKIAQLKENLKALGQAGIDVVKQAAKLLML